MQKAKKNGWKNSCSIDGQSPFPQLYYSLFHISWHAIRVIGEAESLDISIYYNTKMEKIH